MAIIDIMKAFETEPDESYLWKFSEAATWLQTDSIRDGEALWYLTKTQGGHEDNPAYYVEIKPTACCLIDVMAQVVDKVWTDKSQLLDALMPVIRAVVRMDHEAY